MSATPDSGRTDDAVTCPRCQLTFALSDSLDAPAPGRAGGTVTIHPDEPPSPTLPTTPTPVPTQIGRFEVRRFVGEGSFGRVYEAHDPTLKRVVALKVAKAEQMGGPRRVERFQREARAAANLMHPHIVAVFDSGTDAGQHYIACAFVQGRSLAEVIDGGRVEVRESVEIVRKLAEALAYAHKEGVIHRDVKPGNVMLREDGEPLLMDFGLAARLDESEKLTAAGQFMGTPEYSAPEQWAGKASAASDQYSLGCLLFEMLAGEKPFAGSSPEHYLMLHTTQPAPSPRTYRPDLPRDLENIALKCLEKEEGRRYADCQALADDLRRWLDGEPVAARRPGVRERLVRWARKNPAVAALGAAVLLTFAAGATVATLFGMEARKAATRANDKADEAEREASRADSARDDAEREAKEAKKARDLAKENETTAKAETYRANVALHSIRMTAALQEWERHDVARAEALLDEVPAEFQPTFETRHLRELCRREAMTLRGHTDSVRSVAYSPDGARIVSGSDDKTLKVWDARTGQDLLTLKGHTDSVLSVAYSPDGARIVSGSLDKTLKVWDARTGQDLLTLKGHTHSVLSVAYSPDGARVFGQDDRGNILAWDTKSGKLLPDAPKAMPAGSAALRVHDNRRAYADGNLIRIERLRSSDEWLRWQRDEGRVEAILRARANREFHTAELDRAEKIDPFAAVFHLDRLLALTPDERPALLKRRSSVLAAALASTEPSALLKLKRDWPAMAALIAMSAEGYWAARPLARQAVADFDTVADPEVLHAALARHQHSSLDRFYGAVLLRTGNARDAALVLRAAIRHRPPDAPPVDELLLALALVKLDRRDEARKHLAIAVAWMDKGTQPLRAASLVGLRPAGPLAALAAVAHTPPDPRLNPLDPFTGHELTTLRAEVEKALAGR